MYKLHPPLPSRLIYLAPYRPCQRENKSRLIKFSGSVNQIIIKIDDVGLAWAGAIERTPLFKFSYLVILDRAVSILLSVLLGKHIGKFNKELFKHPLS